MTLKTTATIAPLDWDTSPFLEKVMGVAPSVIYVFNHQTQSNEYSNKSLATTLGYSAQEVQEMGAQMFAQLAHPDDLGTIGAYLNRLKTLHDEDSVHLEYRMRHRNGDWVWLLSHDTVFDRAPDGSVLRHIGVATDITAQKNAEERARDAQIKAMAANEELRAFCYSMSHDMKSPSNTLELLLTELLASHRSTLAPDAIELIDMSLMTVNRMELLVDDVLNYTRLVNHDLALAEVSLLELVNSVLNERANELKDAGAVVTVEDLPTVRADPSQMRILFHQLIDNGTKFQAPGNTPNIHISATPDAEHQRYTLSVRDNGIGIDASKHEKIFTIFKRLNNALEYDGTGLGLAICRRIAVNHGSTISVASEPGHGAVFSIGLEAK